jgi:queuosine precursor transporter
MSENQVSIKQQLPKDNFPKYFDIVSSLFVGVYIISQVASAKLFTVGSFIFPGAIIVFPIAYIFGDILTEVYGYERTRRVIWVGFISAILLALVLLAVQFLPAAPNWEFQQAYEQILGFVPRVVLGSLLAYWAGEFANSFVMAKMKVWSNGEKLWARTIGSTVVGQFVDSIVFGVVAFAGVIPWSVILILVGSIYLFKVLYEIVATPLTYFIVKRLKQAEGIDVYDRQTNFSPFRF